MFNIFKKGNGKEGNVPENNSGGLPELLKFMVTRLVDNPDDVAVREIEGDRSTILELTVNDSDMGKVIGKKGRIIKSLRIVVRAAAVHDGRSVSIELAQAKQ